MAMSLSLGGTSVTSRSPISTRPLSIGSSPASSRRAVVLPEPDGPTRTMNSPSLMSKSRASTAGGASLPNTRVAETNFTLATGDLHSLDGSHRQPADKRPLGDPANDDDRHRGDRGRRGQVSDEQTLRADAAHQEHRYGLRVGGGQVDRQEQLVPGEDDADQGRRDHPGQHDWQDHAENFPDPAGAVQPRGLEQRVR